MSRGLRGVRGKTGLIGLQGVRGLVGPAATFRESDLSKLDKIHVALFGLDEKSGALHKIDDLYMAIFGDGNGRKGLIRDIDTLKTYGLKLPGIIIGVFVFSWWVLGHVQMKP